MPRAEGPVAPKRAWLRTAAVFAAVSAVMLWPFDHGAAAPGWPHFDKVVHFVAWLAMAVAAWPALRVSSRAMRVVMVVGALTAWGIAVELMQTAIPRRSGDPLDALADAGGALVSALAMARIEAMRVSASADLEETRG